VDALTSSTTAARLLWSLYETTPLMQRVLSALRPYICPLDPVLQHVPAGARVLDIGSGNGLFLVTMAAINGIGQGVGIEISDRALKAARAVSARHKLPLHFVQASRPDQWPTDQVDVVTMIDVMHHLPPSVRHTFINAAAQRLRSGGRLVYKDMDSRPKWRAAWNCLHDLLLAREWVQLEPSSQVRNWALGAGLRPLHAARYSACGLYGHELMVFEK
jgi:2-polyprenyl-3-methyl-5-hydroxy-6-metoxy-1,4-benzoquinol methylase